MTIGITSSGNLGHWGLKGPYLLWVSNIELSLERVYIKANNVSTVRRPTKEE